VETNETDTTQRRRTFLKTAGGVATVGLAGCTGDDSEADSEGSTDSASGSDSNSEDTDSSAGSSTLSVSIPEAANFDPVQIKGDGSQLVSDHVFSELFTLPQDGVEPVAQLVTGYSVSNGGQTYTFDLREDVTFHNGKQLTAADFVYSWERLAASGNSQEGETILDGGFQIAHETTTQTVDGEEQDVYDSWNARGRGSRRVDTRSDARGAVFRRAVLVRVRFTEPGPRGDCR
jgi:ABC-type dipeptide transport system, periplasmic component